MSQMRRQSPYMLPGPDKKGERYFRSIKNRDLLLLWDPGCVGPERQRAARAELFQLWRSFARSEDAAKAEGCAFQIGAICRFSLPSAEDQAKKEEKEHVFARFR